MPVYTVHAPVTNSGEIAATDRFAFVRDGFHFWAAVLGPIWLAWYRLWLALIGWIMVAVATELALLRLGAGTATMLFVDLLFALLMGLEGSTLRRWTLSRGKWRQLDLLLAEDHEAAERRFFERWVANQRGIGSNQADIDRGSPPPTRNISGQPLSPPPHNDIIGLFPQPGAQR
jgi:hypothetical protein